MPIYTKKSNGAWSTNAKKIFVKAADGLWKSATRLLAKTPSGWVQMWPGDAPANNPNDPVNIRLNSYNGTVATSPQPINAVLYGHDNNGASVIGATPIDITNRKMQLATDETGQTDRYTVETVDIYDLTSNSETNVGEKRFYADAWWLFYQLEATNVWATTKIFSQPIKIIRQAPTFSANSPSLSADYSGTNPFLSLSFSFSDTWWKAADLSRSYIQWWQNTSKTPGGTPIKITYMDEISGLSDTRSGLYSDYNGTGTTVSGNDYYTASGGIPAGQYIIAQVVLINSYTDHYSSPVSAFVSTGDNPTVTALSVLDDNGNSVVDNQSSPRIMSDGYLNFTATVSDAASSTYYLLEPRMYNWVNTNTYQFNTSTVISETSFPTDLTPASVTLNGTTATVKWRIYIDANTLYGIGGPTYDGGQARWQFEFRVSARASSSSTNASASYFTGIASLGGDTVYMQGLDVPAMVNVHPSSAMTLNVTSTSPSLGSSVTFSGTTVGVPTSTYSSFPRRYIIEYGDGTDSGWQYFSTGTSNPSFSGITKTYSNAGTYTATLKWEPQGDPIRSTRSRTITVAAAPGAFSYSISDSTLTPETPSVYTNTFSSGNINYDWNDTANTTSWMSSISGGPEGSRSNSRSVSNDFWTVTGGSSYTTSVYSINDTKQATISWGTSSGAGSYTISYNNAGTVVSTTVTGTSITLTTSGTVSVISVTAYQNSNGTGSSRSGSLSGSSSVTPTSKTSSTRTVGPDTAPTVTYTVTWNANGGSVSPSSSSGTSGSSVTAPTPTRSGYSFNGWYNSSSGGSFIVGGGSSYTLTSNVTLYAQWTSTFTPPSSGAVSWSSGSNFQRTSTLIRWFTDYPSISGDGSFTGMQFEIRTTAGGGTLLASGTRSYPGDFTYPYSGGGTIWAFRCGTSDSDISYSSSARYARVRTVMLGTNGTTYYGSWTGWI